MKRLAYLIKRNETYYFRRTIPKELISIINKNELKFSLKTKSREKAMMMASKLFVNANLFFKEIRNMSFHITNELIDQYLNRYFYESIERLNAQIEKSHQFDYAFYTLKEEYEDQTDFIKRTENIKQRKLYKRQKHEALCALHYAENKHFRKLNDKTTVLDNIDYKDIPEKIELEQLKKATEQKSAKDLSYQYTYYDDFCDNPTIYTASALRDTDKEEEYLSRQEDSLSGFKLSKAYGAVYFPLRHEIINNGLDESDLSTTHIDYLKKETAKIVSILRALQHEKIGFNPNLNYECVNTLSHISDDSFDNQDYDIVKDILSLDNTKKPKSFDIISSIDYTDVLNEMEKIDNSKKDNQQARRNTVNLFFQHTGTINIHDITKKDARAFYATLKKLPSNYKNFENLEQAIAESKKAPLSNSTILKHYNYIKAFFDWSIKNDYYSRGNPFEAMKAPKKEHSVDSRDPFSKDQLEKIFKSPLYSGSKSKSRRNYKGNYKTKDGLYWIPLVALFTGARMNEICQLLKTDIKQDNNVYYFNITDEEDTQSTKNKSSIRQIPIHKELIELGFIDYLDFRKKDKKDPLLFSQMVLDKKSMKYSKSYSKKFRALLKAIEAKTDKTNFHSFRHNFIDQMREQKIPEDIWSSITGHSSSKVTAKYGSKRGIKTLKEAIDKVNYSFIDFKQIKLDNEKAPFY